MPKVNLTQWEKDNFDTSTKEGREQQADSLMKRWKKSSIKDGRVQSYMDHKEFLPKSLRRKIKQTRAIIRRKKAEKKSFRY